MYLTMIIGYRAIFPTKEDAVESGELATLMGACEGAGISVYCEMDDRERFHYFIGVPLFDEQALTDGDMSSMPSPDVDADAIVKAWKRLKAALGGKPGKRFGYGLHTLVRS